MHRSTVARHAKKQAEVDSRPIVSHMKKPSKMLTQATVGKRLAFCMQHQTDDFRNVVVTDRKRFMFTYPGTAVGQGHWTYKDVAYEVYQPNHPQCA